MEKKNIRLQFGENGNFRILMISDIQEPAEYDKRAPEGIRALIKETNPDLVVIGGDIIDGRVQKTAAELRRYLDVFAAPMEEAGLPWMHIFGNHDYDMDLPAKEQNKIYRSYAHCISGVSPRNVPGVSNYAIPVYKNSSNSVGYLLYAFDTMYKFVELRPGITTDDLLLPVVEEGARKWDPLRFEQLMWYWKTSKAYEKQEGATVRSMAFMHVPPYEFIRAINNPEQSGLQESADQKLQCSVLNSGVFATMLERGDVEIIASAHLHRDNFAGMFAGICCALDGCAGYTTKNIDERRGGRIFDIKQGGGYTTEFVSSYRLISGENE